MGNRTKRQAKTSAKATSAVQLFSREGTKFGSKSDNRIWAVKRVRVFATAAVYLSQVTEGVFLADTMTALPDGTAWFDITKLLPKRFITEKPYVDSSKSWENKTDALSF